MTDIFHLPVETVQDLILSAWQDEEFRIRLVAEPMKILEEWGVAVPDGVQLRVVEDTLDIRTIVIPLAPDESELSLMAPVITADACVMSACRPCASYKDRITLV